MYSEHYITFRSKIQIDFLERFVKALNHGNNCMLRNHLKNVLPMVIATQILTWCGCDHRLLALPLITWDP